MENRSWRIDEWNGCYPSNWRGLIVPEAMAHPAKFSSRLTRRIYAHLVAEGWVRAGDSVLDPFGGVALGALDAMRTGLHWYGVELEEKFVKLAQENIDLWNARFGDMPRWGSAQIVRGDSRRLKWEVGSGKWEVGCVLSSPPYADSVNSEGNGIDWKKVKKDYPGRKNHADRIEDNDKRHSEYKYGSTRGQLGGMKAVVSSPPFLQSEGGTPEPKEGGAIDKALYARHAAGNKSSHAYGKSEGQLSSLREGDFGAVVSSPPYSAMQVEKNSKSIDRTKQYEIYKKSGGGQTFEQFCHTQDIHSQGYGDTPGNLANMKAVVSSPPFERSLDKGWMSADERRAVAREMGISNSEHISPVDMERIGKLNLHEYGETPGQLGNMKAVVSSPPYDEARVGKESGQEHCGQGDQYGETDGQLGGAEDFWSAAREIVEQVYAALAPGGHAVWVVKDYVKAKQVVPFCDQWRQLCEAVGFVTLHEHHANLVRNRRVQGTLEGGSVVLQAESKSFFRRLAEKIAALNKYWKTVTIEKQKVYLTRAEEQQWKEYDALSKSEKKKRNSDGLLEHKPPNAKSILGEAKETVFKESGERVEDWNKETRIDWETVLCMVKEAESE